MWPFTPTKKQANKDDLDDLELPPSSEIIQTSIDPAILPYIKPDEEPAETKLSHSYYRLGFHPVLRIELVGGLTGLVGFAQGLKKGSDVAVLCYRAENAHHTPTSLNGWYLYNKSKNYHAMVGGVKQGLKTGGKYFAWSALFLSLEGGLDAARGRVLASRKEDENGELRSGQADFLNTVSAGVATAGIYSWWTGMDQFAAGRMTRGAVRASLLYGLGQDALASMRGERAWYIDGILRLAGRGDTDSISKLETKEL